MSESPDLLEDPLTLIGHYDFGDLHFEVYEGKGGHLKGETVLIEREQKVIFSGDIYINVHDLTEEQAKYNQYAPVLMTSVDTDRNLCAEERHMIMNMLEDGKWKIFGAHGMMKEKNIVND